MQSLDSEHSEDKITPPYSAVPFMLEIFKEACRYYCEHKTEIESANADIDILKASVDDFCLAWGTIYDEICDEYTEKDLIRSSFSRKQIDKLRTWKKLLPKSAPPEYINALKGVLTSNLSRAIDRLLQDREALSVERIRNALLDTAVFRRAQRNRDIFDGEEPLDVALKAACSHGFLQAVSDAPDTYRAITGLVYEQHQTIETLWGRITENARRFIAIAAREFHEVASTEFVKKWNSEPGRPRASMNRTFSFRFAAPDDMKEERINERFLQTVNSAIDKLEAQLQREHPGHRRHVEYIIGLTHEGQSIDESIGPRSAKAMSGQRAGRNKRSSTHARRRRHE